MDNSKVKPVCRISLPTLPHNVIPKTFCMWIRYNINVGYFWHTHFQCTTPIEYFTLWRLCSTLTHVPSIMEPAIYTLRIFAKNLIFFYMYQGQVVLSSKNDSTQSYRLSKQYLSHSKVETTAFSHGYQTRSMVETQKLPLHVCLFDI